MSSWVVTATPDVNSVAATPERWDWRSGTLGFSPRTCFGSAPRGRVRAQSWAPRWEARPGWHVSNWQLRTREVPGVDVTAVESWDTKWAGTGHLHAQSLPQTCRGVWDRDGDDPVLHVLTPESRKDKASQCGGHAPCRPCPQVRLGSPRMHHPGPLPRTRRINNKYWHICHSTAFNYSAPTRADFFSTYYMFQKRLLCSSSSNAPKKFWRGREQQGNCAQHMHKQLQ